VTIDLVKHADELGTRLVFSVMVNCPLDAGECIVSLEFMGSDKDVTRLHGELIREVATGIVDKGKF
jgi:hypothetical protein